MADKILNTMRGSGTSIREYADRWTARECRERRERNRVSYCIVTKTSGLSEATLEVLKKQDRKLRWP